jgi:hypothetical protein
MKLCMHGNDTDNCPRCDIYTQSPRDYVGSQERVPRAERREDDGAVLVCITMFGIFGMCLGALLMWLIGGC